jgi:glucosyl-3-phosphoglycerate synthase
MPVALQVALAVADATDAGVTLLHAAPERVRDLADDFLREFRPLLRGLDRLRREVRVIREVVPTIVEEAPGHQVIVLGATEPVAGRRSRLGPVARGVAAGTEQVVIVVKAAPEPPTPPPRHWEPVAPAVSTPLSVLVDKWFAENTFHSREFADLERLVAMKEAQGLTISLGLPALNEEETVGNVIQTIQKALVEEVPLLDEMVLIDSGSVDSTREIAADLGIPVVIHQEVLPQYGAYHGKGEALWKSLYILKGDIIAWVDTDIANIHPRFVYGILGPLLREPRIQYVKGFYRRPLRRGEKIIAGGGGRVTELTARPLINLFFPELSGLIQPLAGEYAGRRGALEQVPFFTGYGVETGLLIDILGAFGLQAVAQVDLLKRIHHNQPLSSLSKMSFAIIQVAIRRLEDRLQVHLMEEVNKTMNLIRYEPQRFHLEAEEIRERERPPMVTLPEYRRL